MTPTIPIPFFLYTYTHFGSKHGKHMSETELMKGNSNWMVNNKILQQALASQDALAIVKLISVRDRPISTY